MVHAAQQAQCMERTFRSALLQITHFRGQQVAADIGVWNPSFDVTPATLIEGIITERVGGRVEGGESG